MSHTPTADDTSCRLIFEGKMTFEFSSELEDRIISAMRRYQYLEVDLSGIHEIDLCGIHLLGLLQSLGDKRVTIVAASSVVEAASSRLLASFRGASLGRVAKRETAVSKV